MHANYWVVGGDYFRALGIPFRAGRAFTAAEQASSVVPAASGGAPGGPARGTEASAPQVVIIDELLARALFPSENPVGQTLEHLGTVVGVVGPTKKNERLTRASHTSDSHERFCDAL